MAECQGMIEPQALQHDIQLTFCEFTTPWFVVADRVRIKQVLINLLSNSIKYNSEHGTVMVQVSHSSFGKTRVSITDTGDGLTPDQISQLFQPFNRLGQEAGVEEGTGIGLVVAKKLVELMGGAIGVESAVGVGSVFWFDLDSAEMPAFTDELSEHLDPLDTEFPLGGRMRTILCIEDNPANLSLIARIIARRSDLTLITATTATAGISLAHATVPEVILMDINLPDISGFDALRILAEDPITSKIPVVAISANAMPRDIEKGLKAGFFRYLTKPIEITGFLSTLREALAYVEEQTK